MTVIYKAEKVYDFSHFLQHSQVVEMLTPSYQLPQRISTASAEIIKHNSGNLIKLFLILLSGILVILLVNEYVSETDEQHHLPDRNTVWDPEDARYEDDGPECMCDGENFCYHAGGPGRRGQRFDCKNKYYLQEFGLLGYKDSYHFDNDFGTAFLVAFSANHYAQAMEQAIATTIKYFGDNKKYAFVIFDLGMDPAQRKSLLQIPMVKEIRTFEFGKYPRFVEEFEVYAFKPLMIAELLKDYSVVYYMDADNGWLPTARQYLARLEYLMSCNHPDDTIDPSLALWDSTLCMAPAVSNAHTGNSNYAQIHPDMYMYLPVDAEASKQAMMMGAGFLLFRRTQPLMHHVIKWWILCALERNCIAPPNTTTRCNTTDFSNRWTEYYGDYEYRGVDEYYDWLNECLCSPEQVLTHTCSCGGKDGGVVRWQDAGKEASTTTTTTTNAAIKQIDDKNVAKESSDDHKDKLDERKPELDQKRGRERESDKGRKNSGSNEHKNHRHDHHQNKFDSDVEHIHRKVERISDGKASDENKARKRLRNSDGSEKGQMQKGDSDDNDLRKSHGHNHERKTDREQKDRKRKYHRQDSEPNNSEREDPKEQDSESEPQDSERQDPKEQDSESEPQDSERQDSELRNLEPQDSNPQNSELPDPAKNTDKEQKMSKESEYDEDGDYDEDEEQQHRDLRKRYQESPRRVPATKQVEKHPKRRKKDSKIRHG